MNKFMAAIVMGSTVLAGIPISGAMAATPIQTSSASANDAAAVGGQTKAVNPQTIAAFQAGVTTIDQAEVALGKPAGAVRTPTGGQVIAYIKIRNEDISSDRTPETGTALPPRHKVRYATMLSFDAQGRYIKSWNRTDDLGSASPSALGHLGTGDVQMGAGTG